MSNCVVGSCGFDLPSGVVAEHGVKGSDHLSHHGDDDNLGLFVCAGETFVECFEGRVVSAGAERRHVEDVSDGHPAAVDAAMSPKFAAIASSLVRYILRAVRSVLSEDHAVEL